MGGGVPPSGDGKGHEIRRPGIFWIGQRWLGIQAERPWPGVEDIGEEEAENLLEDILEGGVYGKSSDSRIASGAYSWLLCNSEKQKGMDRLVVQRLFPTAGFLKDKYPILAERPYLLPLIWIWRICTHIKKMGGQGRGREQVLEEIRLGSQRIQLLEQYEIPIYKGRSKNG